MDDDMNWVLRRKFLILLVTLVSVIAVFPLLRGLYVERLLFHILLTLVFVAASLVSTGIL